MSAGKSKSVLKAVRHSGFFDFIQGSFGNGGQNIYVSKAGVVQRIHSYDLNSDGYFDLLFCNSQDHWEKPPTYVYRNVFGDMTLSELPSDGAFSGAVADLNGDGYDDLVLGMDHNGVIGDLNAFIYYGSPEGLSERYQQCLPAPRCTSVAVGDFNGDGRPDIAFLCGDQVRVFYQSELGFEPKRYCDVNMDGEHLAAADLDGDGCSELVVRARDGRVTVYWGASDGIIASRASAVPIEPDEPEGSGEKLQEMAAPEYVRDATPLVKVIHLDHEPHIFVGRQEGVFLVPVKGRSFLSPRVLSCPRAMSIAVGDVNGDGHSDLVLACRDKCGDERSWIYWGNGDRFDELPRTPVPTFRACDVAVGDLDGDGCDEMVFCQNRTTESLTTSSPVYKVSPNGTLDCPVALTSHDARRVFLAKPCNNSDVQVILVNHYSGKLRGDVDTSVFYGGPDGFDAGRRLDLPTMGAVDAVCCDVNDDGLVDVIIANCSENAVHLDPGSFLYLNGQEGFAARPDLAFPTTRAHGVACADINRDGYLDAIFCGFNYSELLIFYGTPDGFDTSNPVRIPMEYQGVQYDDPRWVYLADLNNDGWLDLVVPQISYDRSFILWGGPNGFSMDRCQPLSVVNGTCARAADLTGNGYLDLVIGGFIPTVGQPHDSFVYIYWNGPDGLNEQRRTLLPANGANAMSIADFNNDGLLDIFVCSYHDGKSRDIDSCIYWNRETCGFSAMDRTTLFTHSASGCVAADFNEDGWTDLAIAYHKVYGEHVAHSAVWWNGPDGFSEGRVTTLPTYGPHGMVSAGPGNIVDRGSEEYYVSCPLELPEAAAIVRVSWEAESPPKTWVRAQLRFADAKEGLEQSEWTGSTDENEWLDNGEVTEAPECQRWLQYRLALGARDNIGTPRVTEVNISWE